jgi:hypothetical protein
MQNAQAGNPYTGRINSLANDLLGGGTDRTGLAQGAYNDYKSQAQPFLSSDYLNPFNNPAFKQYLDTVTADASNSANNTAAAMGRDGSGYAAQNLARGIAQGTAPIFANQYNQNVATQRGVSDNLYNAGNSTTGLLSGLDQTALGNRQAGVGAAGSALEAQNYGPGAVLSAAGLARNLPLQNIGNISSLLTPLAQLGGTGESNGYSQQHMTYQQPLTQTVGQWANIAQNSPQALQGAGKSISTLGNWFSPF